MTRVSLENIHVPVFMCAHGWYVNNICLLDDRAHDPPAFKLTEDYEIKILSYIRHDPPSNL